ncbi:MAG: hypothetical protein ACKVP0_26410 [Pirellulaceae bacterium]
MFTKIENEPLFSNALRNGIPELLGDGPPDVSAESIAISTMQPPASGSSPRKYLLIGMSLIALAIVGYYFSNRHLTTERPNPVLDVAQGTLDIGSVDATNDFIWKLKVINRSARAVQITDMRASCGCTEIVPRSFKLGAGDVREVELHMNLAVTKSTGSSGFETPIEIRVAPVLAESNDPQPFWTLTGIVKTPCLLDSNAVVFSGADEIVAGQSAKEKTVFATTSTGDIIVTAKPEHEGDAVVVKRLPGSDKLAITVRPAANRAVGWFESKVELNLASDSGKSRGQLLLKVKGEVVPEFYYQPRLLTFGTVPIGAKRHKTIEVDCTRGRIVDASPLGPGLDVSVIEMEGGATSIGISLVIPKIGPGKNAVHVIYESNDGAISTAEIPVWFHGVGKD